MDQMKAVVKGGDGKREEVNSTGPQSRSATGFFPRAIPIGVGVETNQVIRLITLQGLPAAKTASGMSRVTTLPAPMTVRSPMATPGQMMAAPPTQTSEPMLMGLANSSHWRLISASIGWVAV